MKIARVIVAVLLSSLCVATARAGRDVVVAADGSGDFTTIQSAIDTAPAGEPRVIRIKRGTYREQINVPKEKTQLTLIGEDAATTVIMWNWNAKTPGEDGKPVGTGRSASVTVRANDFTAENLTFENISGDNGQAVALAASADRQIYRRCRMIGWQDTLYANGGRQLFQECYIEGRVDFIFGSATAVFDRCELHSKNGGYVTAASTAKTSPFGYVFLDCKLTGVGKEKAFLGRPWRPDAAVAFIRCDLGAHIHPRGWDNWGNRANEATARFAEYDCTGPGTDLAERVAWAKDITDEEAAKYTVENILAGDDHWNPIKPEAEKK